MKLSTLARRNVSHSKSVIFIIALASMLICVVINLAFSIQRAMIENILETVGDNHARYSSITPEQVEIISQSSEVERVDMHLLLRDFGVPASGRMDQIGLMYSSGLGQVAGFGLTSGNPPNAENEAAIPPHVAHLLGIESEVGAEFELIITAMNGQETARRFTVSGILQQQRVFSAMNSYPMFISETLARQFDNDLHLFVRFKNATFVRSTANKLAERIGGISERDFSLNEQYLSANLQDGSTLVFAAVVLLIVCSAGALAIFNAFNLSLVRRIHHYGLLAVIGSSQKQIQNCVRLEAMYCSVLGLPFGLIGGTFMGYWGILVFENVMVTPLRYVMSPIAYILSVVVTLATVLIGVSIPARKASQIAPVEAVRFSDATEGISERKTIEHITLNALANVNIARAKRRVIGAVLALSMSGILLLGFSAAAFSVRGSIDALAGQMVPGDITITAGLGNSGLTYTSDPLPRELAEAIRSLDGVSGAVSVMGVRLLEVKDSLNTVGSIIGVGSDAMQTIIGKVYDGNPTLADFGVAGNVIAVMHSGEQRDIYVREFWPHYDTFIAEHKVGNTLNFTPYDHNGQMLDEEEVSMNIIGIVYMDDVPQFFQRGSPFADFYTLSENITALGLDDTYKRLILTIDDDRHDSVYDAVQGLTAVSPELAVRSFALIKDELTRQITGIILIVMLMLAVIALTGITNLVGATFMGVEQRNKELGVLMAVGLGRKSVGRLLLREGTWVSLFCTALSAVCGLGLGLGLFALLRNAGADYLRFVFPVWPLAIVCAMMWIAPHTVTLLAVRRLRRFTIVELLGRQT